MQFRILFNLTKTKQVFVHVSTAFAITKNGEDNVIEEKLYPAPGEIEQVYDFIRKYNNDIKKTKDFLGTFY